MEIEIKPLFEKKEFKNTVVDCVWSEWDWVFKDFGFATKEILTTNMFDTVYLTEYTQIPMIFVATNKKNELVGIIALDDCDITLENLKTLTPWLTNVYVMPEFRGKGIAGKLVEHVKNEAKSKGYNSLFLWTENAENLYKKHNFEIYQKTVYLNQNITVMNCDLNPNNNQ